jgi:hypothetical protein
MATRESELGTSLVIMKHSPKVPPAINAALRRLRVDWVTPGGEDVSDSLDFYRKARELAYGYYYRWIWDVRVSQYQKETWLRARSEWRKIVRQESR